MLGTLPARVICWAALEAHSACCLTDPPIQSLKLVQVSLPANYTQFLNASALKGVRIGVFRQIRCGRRPHCTSACCGPLTSAELKGLRACPPAASCRVQTQRSWLCLRMRCARCDWGAPHW